jgi:hypothetical protein
VRKWEREGNSEVGMRKWERERNAEVGMRKWEREKMEVEKLGR